MQTFESPRNLQSTKRPLEIDLVFRRIRKAVALFPKAALFELAERGHSSPFEQLAACLISVRTLDEVTLPASLRLFAKARTAAETAQLSIDEIDESIRPCTFHEAKARQIREAAERVVREYGGELPCERDALLSFRGIGPKCAHLILGIACRKPYISVDTHVHRVTNRWGYVSAPNPEKTLEELEAALPRKYRIEINRILVPFGKHVCTGAKPWCSLCPVEEMCLQVGVRERR